MNRKLSFIFLLFFFLARSAFAISLVDEIVGRVNDVVCIILCIIWYIIAALVALILLFAGVKYMTSESAEGREESKKRIVQAITGLIIVLVAAPFVNFLIEHTNITQFESCDCDTILTPKTTTTTIEGTTSTTIGTTTTSEITSTTTSTTTTTETTTSTTSSTSTSTTSTTTSSTTTTLEHCEEACINAGYTGGWECKDVCLPEPEEYDMGKEKEPCAPQRHCCCKPSTTTTSTTSTSTTTSTTSSTTTTIACATDSCPNPEFTCDLADDWGVCWCENDPSCLKNRCGDIADCCCQYYGSCCH